MTKRMQSRSLNHYVVLVLAYVVLSFFIPLSRTTRESYNLSLTQAHIVAFIYVLKLFWIWFVSFFS
jgi:hypothetical protein